MHPLEQKITALVLQKDLIGKEEQTLVVGISGGPDSVALLHLLLPLRHERGLRPVAAYVNHGLRPSESEREKAFVASLCKKLSIPFEIVRVDVRSYAKLQKKSLEHAARDLRYKALRQIAASYSASLIAVGHTADDQSEELLIRLLRGSGRKGLSGMQMRTDGIIRPILTLQRKEILRYLDDKNISFCIDSSNTDMRFTRNRVRHSLLPFLEKEFDKGVRRALCKTADSLAADEEVLDDLAENGLQDILLRDDSQREQNEQRMHIDRQKFVALPSALQRRIVEKILWRMHCSATYSHIMKIIEAANNGRTGSELHLSRGLRVGVQRKYLELLYPRGQTPWRGKLYDR